MAEGHGDAGMEVGGVGRGQRKSRRAYPDWLSADRDAQRCTELHPLAPAEEGEKGVVYIVRDGTGIIKVGFTCDLSHRLWSLQGLVGKKRHPLRLLRAVRLPSRIAGRTERRVHKLLEANRVYGEWFRVTRRVASEALDEAVRQIMAGVKLPPRPRGIKNGKGRPLVSFTDAELKDGKAAWRNLVDYPTWDDVRSALPDGFTVHRAHRLWGPRKPKK